MEAHSNGGLKKVAYARSLVLLRAAYKLPRRKPRVSLAFEDSKCGAYREVGYKKLRRDICI